MSTVRAFGAVVALALALTIPSFALAQDAPPSSATGSPVAQPAPPPPPQPQPQPQPYYYGLQPQPQPYYYGPQPQPQPYYYPPPRGRYRPRIVGYRNEDRAVKALWVPGLVGFCVGYLLDVIATPIANSVSLDRSDAVEEDAWAWSLLPVVGPIVQLAIGAPHPAIPITSGLLQIAGLSLFIAGLSSSESVRVPIYEGEEGARADLGLAPLPGGGRVQLSGHF